MSFLSRASSVSVFAVYLLPSLPFRRRKTSTDSTSSTDSASSRTSSLPGDALERRPAYLGGHESFLRCGSCSADLCMTSAIVSRGFTGRWGRAYLVAASDGGGSSSGAVDPESGFLPNTHIHRPVPRQLVTGAHTVSDVSCMFCDSILGWKYIAAEEDSQKYKVGKYILETKRISVCTRWEGEEGVGAGEAKDSSLLLPPSSEGMAEAEDAVEFDSQDEDECEDLFAGLWTPGSALKRRQAKNFGRNANR